MPLNGTILSATSGKSAARLVFAQTHAAESSLPKTRTTRLSQLLLINGPNLNLLGSREPEVYGRQPLADLETALASDSQQLGHQPTCSPSNHEGAPAQSVPKARP